MAAFEVEKSTSIDSGITRFRELFAATPTLNIPAYIIIPDKREKEAQDKISSLANRREGITERIKYILFSDILGKEDVNIAKIAKGVS
jgi:type II restriction enzyme